MDYKEKVIELLKSKVLSKEEKEKLADIFPELKESEDERIKKAIKKALQVRCDGSRIISDEPVTLEEAISWLEEQGEQKPVELTDLRTWKYIVDAVLTEREGIGQYIDSHWTTEVAEKLQKRFGNIEQKPVEYVNGEDYGIDGLYVAMNILNKTLGQVEGYQSDDGILEHKAAMTAVKKLYKQKPVELEKEEKSRLMKKCVHRAYQQGYDTGFHMATTELEHKQEWSEEDEHRREDAIYFLETAKKHYASTSEIELTIDWLKSLRPQKQEQWNEQDIEMIDWLIRCCEKEYEELCNDRYGHQEIVSDLKRDCRKKWDWLESLKSKFVPQKQWKPSKDEMDALAEALSLANNCGEESAFDLRTLYEELKKLKA